MESKLRDLKEGEHVGIEVWPVVAGMKRMTIERQKELFLNEFRDNIGRGVIAQKGTKQVVAVLLDIDFETNPNKKRYIFSYYDREKQMDLTVDTLSEDGWKVFDISAEND
jgi:hypothetical protein